MTAGYISAEANLYRRPKRNAFGYDAVDSEGKRRPATGILRSEDAELPPDKRRKLVSQAREMHRNFAVAGWMIRRHLDYVSTFNFQAKTQSPDHNRLIERRVANWSQPAGCDIAARHSLADIIRMTELRAVLDGDMGLYKIRDGRIQGIEGDRIRTPLNGLPANLDPRTVVHGVRTDDAGRALAYCICRRSRASDFAPSGIDMQLERIVPARDLILHGYFDRFDQVRGISPLAPAMNALVDLYEGLDYALAKLKVTQLFALALYRGDPTAITETAADGQDYGQVQLGKKPFILDMDPGDRAEFLEPKNPSNEFQSFTQLMIQLTLKCLDIPYSFFNESFTNYSGARQALLQYDMAAAIKRRRVQYVLDQLTAWRLMLFIEDGELPAIPEEELAWEWVPAGMPWIDPLREVQGNIAALSAGLTSRTNILREQGRDIVDVLDQLAEENRLLQERGLPTGLNPDNALIRELATNGV